MDRPFPKQLDYSEPAQAVLRANRRRPTTVAAAAPNSSNIGGAGTSWPPVEVE